MLSLLREISARHLRAAPFRSLLVVVGIALGVAMYAATQATSSTMLASFGEIAKRASGKADLMVVAAGGGVPNELTATLAEVEGVDHAAPWLEITTSIASTGETLLVLGVDFLGDMHFVPFGGQQGEAQQGAAPVIEDPIAFANDASALLVSRRFATRHSLGMDGELDLITAEGAKTFHVRGILEDSGAAGVTEHIGLQVNE